MSNRQLVQSSGLSRQVLAWLLRNRLLQFLGLGGAILAVAPAPRTNADVRLSPDAIAAVCAAEMRRLGVSALNAAETREVVDRAVEDELLYREALRLGLDRADDVVRQRLIQKVLFLAEDLAGTAGPVTDAELRAFFTLHSSRFATTARIHFIHIFVFPGGRAQLAALRRRARVMDTPASAGPPPVGQPFPLGRDVTTNRSAIGFTYGEPFAEAVSRLPLGAWSPPVASKFGWHLVKVLEREGGGQASFEEARKEVEMAYRVDRKERATRGFVAQLAGRFHVQVAGRPYALGPTTRVAEAASAGED
jgi:hypothetical protein